MLDQFQRSATAPLSIPLTRNDYRRRC